MPSTSLRSKQQLAARRDFSVAVVVPIVKLPLTAEEDISLRHLREYLGQTQRYIIGLQCLPKELSDFKLLRFSPRYFSCRYAYNLLMMKKDFYEAFSDYEYILIYQLDSLVFASNLQDWCQRGWDYVGAPWLVDNQEPSKGFFAVGNGGFSLRRVATALAVLRSRVLAYEPKVRGQESGWSEIVFEGLKPIPGATRFMRSAKTLLHRVGYHNNVRWLTQHFADCKRHEDYFWAFQASKFVDQFRIPIPQEALEFSFEIAPRYCFEANSRRLPFGCHAWATYDREFWEPFLLK